MELAIIYPSREQSGLQNKIKLKGEYNEKH